MPFIYYPLDTSVLDSDVLRHKYFVQLMPDGVRLVKGMLHQGAHPQTGNWLEISKIEQDFPERYFVMYTDFDTLVPGSLITADKLPQGKWKELKWRKSDLPFYRVYAIDNLFIYGLPGYPEYITDSIAGLLFVAPEIYDTIHAGSGNYFRYKLYYFQGSFNDLDCDPSKLKLVGSSGATLRVHDAVNGTYIDTFDIDMPDGLTLEALGTMPVGNYALVLGILNDDDEVVEYIVIENAFLGVIPDPR